MDFRLKVFNSVARNLSFTKASKELFISQPAISKHIRELESQYETPLFERSGNQVRLTRAGELLFSHTERLADLLTNHLTGELRLGASTTIAQYVLPPMLSSFIRTFPDIQVSLRNGNSREIERLLGEREITLGLVEGNSRQSGLRYIPFMKDELVVVTHTGSRYVTYDEVSLDQLRQWPLVLRENGSGTLEVLEAALSEHHVKLSQMNILIQLGSTESIKLFLGNMDAVAIVSIRAVTNELKSGLLKVIDIKDINIERIFSFVMPAGQYGGLEENFIHYAERSGWSMS